MDRYHHQIQFDLIGKNRQKILLNKRVLIVGCGALGGVLANNLARAGIGYLRIIDRDYVELTDLQRQVLFDEDDVKKRLPKAIAASNKLKKINSEIEIEAIVDDLNKNNIENLIQNCDLILDGTDNLESRFLINMACVKNHIPWIYTACLGSKGILMNILPGGPCLQCLIPQMPVSGALETCASAGVINAIPFVMASFQTVEAIKILLHDANILREVIFVDLWPVIYEKYRIKKRRDCPVCVQKNFTYTNSKVTLVTTICGRQAYQIQPQRNSVCNFTDLSQRLKSLGVIIHNDYLIGFKTGAKEITIFNDGRAIVKGVRNEKEALSFYNKYIGL